jgi:hypothetical protein
MSRTYTDGTYTSPFAVSPLIKQPALPGVKDDLVAVQDYVVLRDSYTETALNTGHPDEPDAAHPVWVLVAEANKRDLGGDVIQFSRRYARKPSSYSEMGGTIAYNFIGFYGTFGLNITAVTGRSRFIEVVPVRVQRDFFLIGPESYCDYATPQEIPITQEQTYYIGDVAQLTDYLGDSSVLTTPSTPDRTTYEGWIATGAEIVAQPSRVERWQGNIYMRETFYIKAK